MTLNPNPDIQKLGKLPANPFPGRNQDRTRFERLIKVYFDGKQSCGTGS